MSDFCYKCTNSICDFISPSIKPEKTCPVCSSDVVLSLRPITDESLVLNMEGEEAGDEYEAYSAAMKEEETAEALEAERRYWNEVEQDEREYAQSVIDACSVVMKSFLNEGDEQPY